MPTARPFLFLLFLFPVLTSLGQSIASSQEPIANSQRSIPDSLGQPGVSYALARQRNTRLRDIHYDLTFHLPADRTGPVNGEEQLTFSLDQPFPLLLDFKGGEGSGLLINGKPCPIIQFKEHLQ